MVVLGAAALFVCRALAWYSPGLPSWCLLPQIFFQDSLPWFSLEDSVSEIFVWQHLFLLFTDQTEHLGELTHVNLAAEANIPPLLVDSFLLTGLLRSGHTFPSLGVILVPDQ